MAKVELKPSSVYYLNDNVLSNYDDGNSEASIYVYKKYNVKSITDEYVDIELFDQVRWTETVSEPGTSYSYYEWEIDVPYGSYIVIGQGGYSPNGPETTIKRIYKNISDSDPQNRVYISTYSFKGRSSYTEEFGDDYEYIGFACEISSLTVGYAVYAEVSSEDTTKVCINNVIRDASAIVCVNGVIKTASTLKCVDGVIKT